MEYIIVGDALIYGKVCECLVCLCGKDIERAEEMLHKMLTNPDEDDKRRMKGHKNFRIKPVEKKDCWWNDPFLCN